MTDERLDGKNAELGMKNGEAGLRSENGPDRQQPVPHPRPAMLHFSLRGRLVLLVLLAALPALGQTVYGGIKARQSAAANARDDALRLTRIVAADQRQWVEGAHQVLALLAGVPDVSGMLPDECSPRLASFVHQYPYYLNFGVISISGDVLCSALPFTGTVNVSDRPYFQQVLRTHQPSVGNYQVGRITGKASVLLGYPVLDADGELQAVLYAALDLARLNELAAEAKLQLPAGASLYVIDPAGVILARYPQPEQWVGQAFPEPSLVPTIVEQGEGWAERRDVDGVARLYAFTPVGGVADNLYASVAIPLSSAYATLTRDLLYRVAGLLLALALALGMAWYGGEVVFLRRVRALVDTTRKLSAGDLSARTGLAGGDDGLDQLARSFDQMAADLQQRETARQQAAEALRSANQTLLALIQASPVAVVALDGEGKVTLWNPAAQDIFGWSVDETLGQPLPFVPPERLPDFRAIGEAISHGESFRGVEQPILRKDGSVAWVSLSLAPLYDADGKASGAVTLLADITQRKRSQEEREKLEVQLRQAQKMEAVGILAGGVAHDFNNLLTVILGNAELGMAELDPTSLLFKELGAIQSTAQRAATLTQQLLSFSRRRVLQPRLLDLNALVTEFGSMLERVLAAHIELRLDLSPECKPVLADAGALEQVLMNLSLNGQDAMPGGGILRITTALVSAAEAQVASRVEVAPGEYVRLSVIDTGTGMDQDTREHIYEPFFTTKQVGKGTGLGLSVVYGIVSQHNGWIDVQSEPGKGARFDVYLPAQQSPLSPADSAPLPAMAHGSETILLAEDEQPVRELAQSVLESLDYSVLACADGEEAVRLFTEQPQRIDLAILDLMMPRLPGDKAAAVMRAARPDLPVLFITSYSAEVAGLPLSVRADMPLLPKPFAVDELGRRVRELLNRGSTKVNGVSEAAS